MAGGCGRPGGGASSTPFSPGGGRGGRGSPNEPNHLRNINKKHLVIPPPMPYKNLLRASTAFPLQLTIEVKSGSMSGEFLAISRHCREVAPFIILRARRAPGIFRAALGQGVIHRVPSWIATFRTACGALVRPVRPP